MSNPLTADDPSSIAGYRLIQRLGEGGMGRVYLSQTPGGRPLAIKVVRPELAADAEFRRRFQQEVRAAERVQGLYTAPVIDSDTEGAHPWLATAYVAGPSLHEAVRNHGALPLWAAVRAIAGIAEALQAIHGAGVVHRDLKPSNVLLSKDGPKVIDFGIARAIDATSLTRSGVTAGTPAFMAPEQAMGETVTPAADVFALGLIAVFATSGATPFGEGSSPAVVYRIVHEEPDISGVPEALRELVSRCLAKDPALRPTPAEIVGMCGPLLGDAQPPAGGWLPPAVATEIDHRAASLTSPALMPPPGPPAPPLPPVHAAATHTAAPHHATGPQAVPPPARKQGRTVLLAALGVVVALAAVGFGLKALTGDGGGDNGATDQGQNDDAGGEQEPDPTPPDAAEPPPEAGDSPDDEAKEPEPPADPEPAVYEGISIPGSHTVRFYDDPPRPATTTMGVTYEGDFGYSSDWITDYPLATDQQNNTMVLLRAGETGSLDTCRTVTRYTYTIPAESAPPGSEICVTTGTGDIALVTVREYSTPDSPSQYVTVDLTIWRGAAQLD
ncbi:serine/threonine-protein kinase [Streptomyces xiamenensis]